MLLETLPKYWLDRSKDIVSCLLSLQVGWFLYSWLLVCIDIKCYGLMVFEPNRPCHLCLLQASLKLKQLCASNWLVHHDIFFFHTSLIRFGRNIWFSCHESGSRFQLTTKKIAVLIYTFQISRASVNRINKWRLKSLPYYSWPSRSIIIQSFCSLFKSLSTLAEFKGLPLSPKSAVALLSASSFGSWPPIVFAPHPSRLSSAIEPLDASRAPWTPWGNSETPDVPAQDSCTSDGPWSWHGPAGLVRGYPIIARQSFLKTPQREKEGGSRI